MKVMNAISRPVGVSYGANIGKAIYTSKDVVHNTFLPSDPGQVPRIIGWSGSARSGTTALLLLLANHNSVDRIYFQPQKTILRQGGPDFRLLASDRVVCMKEVYGERYDSEYYDPVAMLRMAGVPQEKITWISIVRDPQQAFASWYNYFPENTPERFFQAQNHTIKQFFKYQKQGINVIPLAYELLAGREEEIVSALLRRAHLAPDVDYNLNAANIKEKLVPGQAADKAYYDLNIKSTYLKGKFIYSRNKYAVPPHLKDRIEDLCREQYSAFYKLAAKEFGISVE